MNCITTRTLRQLFILPLLLWATMAQATVLDAPELRCAHVQANGEVQITWLQPPDPTSEFASYEIWSANSLLGPFVNIGSVGAYAQLTFTHIGANANAEQLFYYVETVSTSVAPNTSVPSDTLGTIFLEVGQSTPLGSADLAWTVPHTPLLPSSGAFYNIYLEYPHGTWNFLDQVSNDVNSYLFEISICEDTLNFRVELVDASGCVNVSNVAGDNFSDQTPPSSPVIIVATVDTATGLSNIFWDPSPEPDTQGYIIVQIVNGNAMIIDTLYGAGIDTYEYLNSNANSESEYFTIAAFDTCWSGTPPSPNTSATLPPHHTVHLTTQLDRCASQIQLQWNDYTWLNGVAEYRLHASLDGSPYGLLATLPSGTTSYLHSGLSTSSTYCYVVEAVEVGSNVSLSNIACRTVDYPALPQANYLAIATVQPNGVPLVRDLIDPGAEVKNYKVLRSNNGAPFEIVATLPAQPGPYITYEDFDALTDQRSYEYKIMVMDSCGNESITSNKGTTMLLRAEGDLSGFNNLTWNGYAQWAGVVSSYNIYRKGEMDLNFVLVGNAPPDQWNYSDDVSALFTSNGRFCYYVEAVEAGNLSGINETSASNVACAIQEPGFYLPNAFMAGGYNPTFGPEFSFTDFSNYELIIYNRWGQEYWKTSDPYERWDGVYGNKLLPEGIYAYYVSYQSGQGQTFTRRGHVTFLHAVED